VLSPPSGAFAAPRHFTRDELWQAVAEKQVRLAIIEEDQIRGALSAHSAKYTADLPADPAARARLIEHMTANGVRVDYPMPEPGERLRGLLASPRLRGVIVVLIGGLAAAWLALSMAHRRRGGRRTS
jgi:hypothetical protein